MDGRTVTSKIDKIIEKSAKREKSRTQPSETIRSFVPNPSIIFTIDVTSKCINFVYQDISFLLGATLYTNDPDIFKNQAGSPKPSSESIEIIPFFMQLLQQQPRHHSRQHSGGGLTLKKNIFSLEKNIYLFTYGLEQLLQPGVLGDSLLKCDSFQFRHKTYLIKIYKKKQGKKLIIKDLQYFGIEDIQIIKKNPESFFNLLKIIKDELKVDVNTTRRLSIPSIAGQIFKKNFPKQYELIPKLNSEKDSYIRPGYLGGRNEIYTPIVEHINYYYDVNSLYPYIMKTKGVPVGIPKLRKAEYFSPESFKLESFYGFLRVLVQTPDSDDVLPILPFRLNQPGNPSIDSDNKELLNQSIIYPVGKFESVFFSEELKYALSNGYKIITIYDGIQYDNLAIVFDQFVDLIYKKRTKAQNPMEAMFWKKMLNTLYGRYALIASKIVKSKAVLLIDIKHALLHGEASPITMYEKKIYNNVGIAAAITAQARIYMHKTFMDNKLKPLYMDTDGIFINNPLPENLLSQPGEKELGKFRLVSINSMAVFISNKFYYYKPIKSKNYVYVFRGIPLPFSIESPDALLEQVKEVLLTLIGLPEKYRYHLDIHISIICSKGENKIMSFTFFNKRILFAGVDKILTKPWSADNNPA